MESEALNNDGKYKVVVAFTIRGFRFERTGNEVIIVERAKKALKLA